MTITAYELIMGFLLFMGVISLIGFCSTDTKFMGTEIRNAEWVCDYCNDNKIIQCQDYYTCETCQKSFQNHFNLTYNYSCALETYRGNIM